MTPDSLKEVPGSVEHQDSRKAKEYRQLQKFQRILQSQDDGELQEGRESLLTDRQYEVLRLRQQGLSQAEVAKSFGTTRSNISILEKRAHDNIERAKRTLQQWMMIQAPISLKVREGTDVFDLPKMIFEAADRRSLQLPTTSLDIIVQLRRKAPQLFRRRAIMKDVEIFVTEEGEILIQDGPHQALHLI
jgi:HTH-type transcriptional regulator, fmd operon transcriptional regulator